MSFPCLLLKTRASTSMTIASHADATDLKSEMPGSPTDTDLQELISSSKRFSSDVEPAASDYTEESITPSKERTVFDLNSEDTLGNGSPVEDCRSYSAGSDFTQNSVWQVRNVLSVSSQVSSAKTQRTEHQMPQVKTE